MSKDEKQICLYCKWWNESGFQYFGNCRVNGPLLVPGDLKFPQMRGIDWCGKFEDRPDDHVSGTWESLGDAAASVIDRLNTEGEAT